MNFSWTLLLNLGVIGFGLLLATVIRYRVKFFQKYLIPNALTAGFLLLPFYNYVLPKFGLTSTQLGELVYHLLSISFIAMTLRKTKKRTKGINVYSMSIGILSQYALQAITGLLLTYIFIKTLFPDLFPSFGFLLPLGFALGPGQAFAIGNGWEQFGFSGAGSIGLTFAAIGFLWACFGGVFLINYGIKKKWICVDKLDNLNTAKVKTGIYPEGAKPKVGAHLTTETEAIDSMSFNIAIVFGIYFLTFWFLKFLTWALSFAGNMGHDLAVNLWGISFIFAALIAIIVREFLKKSKIHHVFDNATLTRISGTSVDFMVSASIAAISLVVVAKYWLPILVVSTVGGSLTLLTVPWLSSRLFKDHRFHRTLIVYGASTGTMPTGLALLRVIDAEYETPVASDYMFSSGLTFIFAIPFILIINLPAYSYTTGNPIYFWIAFLISVGYLIFVIISHVVIAKSKSFKNPTKIWYFIENILHKKTKS